MNIGIIGASGYTGEELVHLVAGHPQVQLTAVASRSLAGTLLAEALPRLGNAEVGHQKFIASNPLALAEMEAIETWFLALPHGVAAEYAQVLIEAGKTVIDLSADFRLSNPDTYEKYYGRPHPNPELMSATPYVIPELMQEDSWTHSKLIASPGCYPTSILVPIVPLLRNKLLEASGMIVNSYSAVSGAGRKLENRYLFVDRAESLTPYGLVNHRHLSEIEEQLGNAFGQEVIIQFTPHLAPLRRGILSTMVVPNSQGTAPADIREAWKKTFHACPFIHILPEGKLPDTATVAGTNRVDLAVAADPRTENLIITSALDNVVKGAGGQALQILNHLQNWPETTGLPRY